MSSAPVITPWEGQAPHEPPDYPDPAENRRRTPFRHYLLGLWTAATLCLLLGPISIVILFSFNSTRSMQTFQGFSLEWYRSFADRPDVQQALEISLKIGVAAMIGSTILGTLLAIGLVRYRGRGASSTNILMLLPMVMPEIVLGFSLILMFTQVLLWTPSIWTLIIAHITFSISYTTIVVRSRLVSLGPELEEAAADLYATRVKALWLVVLPNLVPAIIASALLVFTVSFDDFVISFFNSGPGAQPLPVFIYSEVKTGVSPLINAIATTMFALTLCVAVAGIYLPRLFKRDGSGDDTASTLSSFGGM